MSFEPRLPILAALAVATGSIVRVATAQQSLVIKGQIVNAVSGKPVDGAELRVGQARSVLTNSRGMFELTITASGKDTLHVTRIGYKPKAVPLEETEDRRMFVAISLEPVPVELAPVVVRADTSTVFAFGRLADFYNRSKFENGRFFTRDDILKRAPHKITDIFGGVAGIRSSTSSSAIRSPARTFTIHGCIPAIFVNEILVNGSDSVARSRIDSDFVADPRGFDGVELYKTANTAPFGYRDPLGCGSILIWKRI